MLDPETMQAIKKKLIEQEKKEEPKAWKRYLKNVWSAIRGEKTVIIIEKTNTVMPAFMELPKELKGMEHMLNEAAMAVFRQMQADMHAKRRMERPDPTGYVDKSAKNVDTIVKEAEEDDDGLEIFKRAFSMRDDGASE